MLNVLVIVTQLADQHEDIGRRRIFSFLAGTAGRVLDHGVEDFFHKVGFALTNQIGRQRAAHAHGNRRGDQGLAWHQHRQIRGCSFIGCGAHGVAAFGRAHATRELGHHLQRGVGIGLDLAQELVAGDGLDRDGAARPSGR